MLNEHHSDAAAPTVRLLGEDGGERATERVPAALSVTGMTVAYGAEPAIFSVDARFEAGALTAIVGPNGAGKSSLLKGALGIVTPLSGRVEVFGAPLKAMRSAIAYVPQRASIDWDFPARVRDVVRMGVYRDAGLVGRIGGRLEARIDEALDRVGMGAFAGRQIGALSGGQQQRVFLARALAQNAPILLLDEPFAGVDAATEHAIFKVFETLRAEGRTIVAVHHDLSTVSTAFDNVLIVNVRKIAEGPVATAFTAENLRLAYGSRWDPSSLGMETKGMKTPALEQTAAG